MKQITNKKKVRCGGIFLIALFLALLLCACGGAKEAYRTISISELLGTVTVEDNGSDYEAYSNMHLREGHALTTDLDSYARMVLDDNKYVKLEEDSRATFEALGKPGSGKTVISLERGVLTNELTQPLGTDESYVVNTPNAVLAVRGTFFRVEVRPQPNGEVLTDIYTYGGAVQCSRVLPGGEVVEEQVIVSDGYKTTISMDTVETVYLVEEVLPDLENVEPIQVERIPEGDLVDMYVASSNGHELFITVGEIWYHIEDRGIDVSSHISAHDQTPVKPPEPGTFPRPEFTPVENPTEEEQPTHEEPVEELPVPEQGEQPGDEDAAPSDEEENPVEEEQPVPEEPVEKPPIPEQEEQPGEEDSAPPDEEEKPVEEPMPEEPSEEEIPPEENLEEEIPPAEETPPSELPENPETPEPPASDEEPDDPNDGDSGEESDTSTGGGSGSSGGGGSGTPSHTHTQVTTRTEATCTTPGSIVVRCETCNELLRTETIPALNHPEETCNTIPATCTVNGKAVYSCNICGEELRTEILSATGHTEVATTTATCIAEGIKTTKCSVCRDVISEVPDPVSNIHASSDICTMCGGVEIASAVRFDSAFQAYVDTVDSDSDGYLESSEGEAVTSISLSSSYSGITSLRGIEYFPNLTSLSINNCPDLETLNLSANTKLQTLDIRGSSLSSLDLSDNVDLQTLQLTYNNLSSLDLSGSTNLQSLMLNESALGTLDLSQSSMLSDLSLTCSNLTTLTLGDSATMPVLKLYFNNTGIRDFSFLSQYSMTEVNFYNQSVEAWEPTAMRAEKVMINGGTLPAAALSFSGNTTMQTLYIHNVTLDLLDLSDCTSLNRIETSLWTAPTISEIDLRNCTSLGSSYIVDLKTVNQLNTVYVYGTGTLGTGLVKGEGILINDDVTLVTTNTSPGASDGIAIDEINFPDQKFRNSFVMGKDSDGNGYLETAEREAVTSIYLTSSYNVVTTLKGIEYFQNLESLTVAVGTNLDTLDLTQNTSLRELRITNSVLSELDLSANIHLQTLELIGNGNLVSLNFDENTELTLVTLSNNSAINSLNFSANINLQTLSLEQNSVKTLDLSNNHKLRNLSLTCSNLETLTLGTAEQMSDLQSLVFSWTKISDFKFLSQYSGLAEVSLTNQTITDWTPATLDALVVKLNTCTFPTQTVDFSNNTTLTELWVHNMTLDELNLAGCTALTNLTTNQFVMPGITAIDLRNCSGLGTQSVDLTTVNNLSTVYTYGTSLVKGTNLSVNDNVTVDSTTPIS